MSEEEFDASTDARPFGLAEAMQAEIDSRRCIALGMALWGTTPGELQRQLLLPHPEIPAGFNLSDFRRLQQSAETISGASGDPRFNWLPRSVLYSPAVFVGMQSFTTWEARCEVVRRAIEYLGGV